MRVLMTGGGTGGHVNPAIAIADTIMENQRDSTVAFVGTSRGIENKLVPDAGYKLYHVEMSGLRRSLSLKNIKTAYYVLTAPHKAKKLIHEFRPDLVVGTGGYVCWPVVKAAAEMGIPTALHESNAIPGIAVRMLEGKVDKIFVNFEKTKDYLKHPEKAEVVGNPLRGDFSSVGYESARKELGIDGKYEKFVLSCGGSMGAEKVNDLMLAFMRDYVSLHPEVYHVHATGSIEKDICRAQFESMGLDKCENIKLVEYIYDMPLEMAAADVVINRAGAMTLSELAYEGKAAVLIPSPNVTDNHQYKNAMALAEAGAAMVFEESKVSEREFADSVASLLDDGEKRKIMSRAIKKFAVTDSKKLIYRELVKISEQKK